MDRNHFPAFYRENAKRIYRFLYFRVGGKKEVAEDLAQDVFLKALAAFESYDPDISQASWIFTIARNHLINFLEKQRTGISLEEIENTWWDRVDWGERAAQKYDAKRLLDALNRLPPADAELVRLKHLQGWSYEEIAMQTGKKAGALRVQGHRALKALKQLLKQK